MAGIAAGVPLVGVFACVAMSALVLLPGSGSNASAEARRLGRAVLRRARRALASLGRTRFIGLLLGVEPFRELADLLAGAMTVRGASGATPVGKAEAASMLVAAVGLGSVAAGLLFASPAAGAAAGIGAVAAGVAYVAAAKKRRAREVAASMPGLYRTLSVVMGSGQTLAQAVEYVGGHEKGPAAEVFARMGMRLRCGMGTEEAVELLAVELGCVGSDLLATALVISHRTGSPLKDLLLRSARLVERAEEFERLLSVKTAQVRLSVRIVCLMPAVMIGLLALISPDFQEGLATPVGIACVLMAALLDGLALFIIRRMIKGVF